MGADSMGEQLLQVFGGNEILILPVLAKETGGVGTERNNPQMFLAREIQRIASKLCRQSLAFKRLRHFGVKQNDAAGRKAVGEHGAKAVDVQLESVCFFVLGDRDVIQAHVHWLAPETLRLTGKVYQGTLNTTA